MTNLSIFSGLVSVSQDKLFCELAEELEPGWEGLEEEEDKPVDEASESLSSSLLMISW